MKINLLDISEDGHEFKLKFHDEKQVDEKVLAAVEGLKDFNFKIFIQKTGDIYTAQGEYSIEQDRECSLCAEEILLPIQKKFTEYLMNEGKAEQKGHTPHNGLNIHSEQDVTFVKDHEFDIGEFAAEIFALVTTPYPKCLDTAACEERQKENEKYYKEKHEIGHPAFSVLSKLKKK
jgi:uncharacterized metal-binding protein YceD (DUF177 family)